MRLQLHPNEWFVRTARRLLQERAAAGKTRCRRIGAARDRRDRPRRAPPAPRLWALHVTGGLDEKARLALLDHRSPQVRAWAVRLLVDEGSPSADALSRFQVMADHHRPDPGRLFPRQPGRQGSSEISPLVRLYLVSALQRIPVEGRWPLAEALVKNDEDQSDDNQTLLIWYGLEPLVATDRGRAVAL